MSRLPPNSLGLSVPSRHEDEDEDMEEDMEMPEMEVDNGSEDEGEDERDNDFDDSESDEYYDDSYIRAPSEEIPLSPTIVTEFSDQDMTRQVAIDFIDYAERVLGDRPEIYKEFTLSMQDWHRKLFMRDELLTRIRSLFDGDWELLQAFRPFVPPVYLDDWDAFRLGGRIPNREL